MERDKKKSVVAEYYDLSVKEKEIKDRKEYLKAMIVTEFGVGEHPFDDFIVKIKHIKEKKLNTKLVKQTIPADKLDKYLEISEYDRLEVKKIGAEDKQE
jgi:hypothetical protein